MENILEIKNIEKQFKNRIILRDINLSIKENSKIAILGNNGSGKSTLIKIILGLLKQTSGQVFYPKYNNNRKIFLHDLGIQFQEGDFPLEFTIKQVIEITIEQKSEFKYSNYNEFKKQSKEKINKYLDVFKLKKIYKSKIKNLSGGEKQRLNIMLALISNPKILILDEISTGLDIKSQRELITFIKNYTIEKKITLIIVSHIIYEIDELVDSIVIIDDGIITLEKKVLDLKNKYGTLALALEEYFVKENRNI